VQNIISVFPQAESRAKVPWARSLLLLRTIYTSLTTGSTKIDPLQIVQGPPRSIHYKSSRVYQDRSITDRSDPSRSIHYKSFRVHQDRSIINRSESIKIDPLQIIQGPPRSIHYKSFRVHQDRSVTNLQSPPRSIHYKSFSVHQDRPVTNLQSGIHASLDRQHCKTETKNSMLFTGKLYTILSFFRPCNQLFQHKITRISFRV
jgi:hypothetical protein